MQKCNEAYLQDSPPFYTEQYHTWKVNQETDNFHGVVVHQHYPFLYFFSATV